MRQELDDLLCLRYPEIFRNRHGSMKATSMCWGFTCGDGWFDLIDGMCAKIAAAVEEGAMPPVVAVQVKQKMGVFCFYTTGGNSETTRLWVEALHASETICEECGAHGSLSALDAYFQVLCPTHYASKRASLTERFGAVLDFKSPEDIPAALLKAHRQALGVFATNFGLPKIKEIWADLEKSDAGSALVPVIQEILAELEARGVGRRIDHNPKESA